MLGLVEYSDSDEEADDASPNAGPAPLVSAPAPRTAAPAPQPAQTAGEPSAKRARKEINLQQLLQRQGVALPFEEAAKVCYRPAQHP